FASNGYACVVCGIARSKPERPRLVFADCRPGRSFLLALEDEQQAFLAIEFLGTAGLRLLLGGGVHPVPSRLPTLRFPTERSLALLKVPSRLLSPSDRLQDRPAATCPSSPASPRCRTPASCPRTPMHLSL